MYNDMKIGMNENSYADYPSSTLGKNFASYDPSIPD
jgi:hypothetical protein